MNTTWQAFLAARGARFNDGLVTDFGNPTEEFIAAKEATVLVPLNHLALIGSEGEDAGAFLHNQLTSDVNHLAENAAQYSSWCTHKGRMQASFILYRRAAGYRALLSTDLIEPTLKRLKVFVLRSKVALTDLSGDEVALGIAGSHARDLLCAAGLSVPTNAMETMEFPGGTLLCLDTRRFVLVATTAALSAIYETLSIHARPTGTPVWQWLDIQAGIVWVTAATKEEFVPQMVNFDKIGGVSFNKGCYPGQEVVARTQYLGKIKRHLYRFRMDGLVSAGTALFQGENHEQACGLVACATQTPDGAFTALAVIKEGEAASDDIRLEIPGIVVSAIEAVAA